MKRLTIAVLCGFAMLALAPSAPAAIRITKIYFDSPGADTGSNFSLNAEWIRLRNTSARSRLLTGWKIRDAQGHVYTFGTYRLGAGLAVTVHTGTVRIPRVIATGAVMGPSGTTTATRRGLGTRPAPSSTDARIRAPATG